MATGVVARSRVMPVGRQAIFAVVVAVVLWSLCSLFVRAGDTDAMVFTTWRLWIAVPPLAIIVTMRRRGPRAVPFWPPDVSKRHWTFVMLGAGAFFVSGAATAFAALDLTRLLDVTLIGALQPILIIGFAVAFLHERVRRSHLLRAIVAVAGTIFVTIAASSSGSWSLAGDVMAVISLVLNACWFIYGRVMRTNFEVDPFSFMFGTLFCGAILLTPVTLLVHGSLAIGGPGLFFVGCVVVAGTSAHLLMIWAHRYVPTSISSPLLLLEPPLVAAGAWVWFGESLNAAEIIGSAVVVASLWGVVRSAELEEVEHDLPDPVPPT